MIGAASLLVIVFFNLFRQAEAEKARVIEAQSTLFLARANVGLDNNIPAEPIQHLAQAVALDPNNNGAIARLTSLATERNFARKIWEKDLGQSGRSTGSVVSLDADAFAFPSANNHWRLAAILPASPHPMLRETCLQSGNAQDSGSVKSVVFASHRPSSPVDGARVADAEIELTAATELPESLAKFTLRCAVAPNEQVLGKNPLLLRAVEPGSGASWVVMNQTLLRIPTGDAPRESLDGLDDVGEISRVIPSRNGHAVIVSGTQATVLYTRSAGTAAVSGYVRRMALLQANPDQTQTTALVAASFDETGRYALVKLDNGRCQLWETTSAKLRWSRSCRADVHAFVPGKPWLALADRPQRPLASSVETNGSDGQLKIVSLTDGRPLGVLKQSLAVNQVGFSASGEFAVVASQDRTAKVYRLPDLTQVGQPLLHEGAVVEAHFRTASAAHVVTASFDGSARVWDWQLGKLVVEPMLHPGPVLFARPVQRGAYLLTQGDDRRLRLWRLDSPAPLAPSATPRIGRPALSPAGDWLAYVDQSSGGTGGRERVMLARVADRPVSAGSLIDAKPIYLPSGAVERMFFSSDSQLLAIAGQQPWLALVHTSTGVEERVLRFSSPVERAAIVSGPKLLVVQLADDSLRVIDLVTGRASGLAIQLNQSILDFGISHDGKWLSVATGAQVQVFDLRTGYLVARLAPGGIIAAAVHPARPEIAYATRSGLSIWRPSINPRGIKPRDPNKRSAGADSSAKGADREFAKGEGTFLPLKKLLVGLRFTPDGGMIAAHSIDGLVSTWDAATLAQGAPMRHSSAVVSMGMSGDGRWLTTTTLDGLARIWDHRTGQPMTDAINLHSSNREFRIVGSGTWALVESLHESTDPASGSAGLVASRQGEATRPDFEFRMLALGFKESPPNWFVPTATALAGGVVDRALTGSRDAPPETPGYAWWESWLQYVASKNGVSVK